MAKHKKILNITMLDGDADGGLECCLKTGDAYLYRVSSEKLSDYKSVTRLSKAGVYFLIGKDEDKEVVYVGQANERLNGEGVLLRVSEHDKPKENYWTEAIMIVHKANSLGATELNYLENRFCNLANEIGKGAKNKKNPTIGNYSEETEVIMEPFIDEVLEILKLLGYKTFTKEEAGETNSNEGLQLFIRRDSGIPGRKIDAKCLFKDGIYILLKGSLVAKVPTDSCSKSIKDRREKLAAFIDKNGIVTEDLVFEAPLGISGFVVFGASNGKIDLKTVDGRELKEFL